MAERIQVGVFGCVQDSTEKQWVQDLEISRRQNPHIPRSTGEYEDEKDEL